MLEMTNQCKASLAADHRDYPPSGIVLSGDLPGSTGNRFMRSSISRTKTNLSNRAQPPVCGHLCRARHESTEQPLAKKEQKLVQRGYVHISAAQSPGTGASMRLTEGRRA